MIKMRRLMYAFAIAALLAAGAAAVVQPHGAVPLTTVGTNDPGPNGPIG